MSARIKASVVLFYSSPKTFEIIKLDHAKQLCDDERAFFCGHTNVHADGEAFFPIADDGRCVRCGRATPCAKIRVSILRAITEPVPTFKVPKHSTNWQHMRVRGNMKGRATLFGKPTEALLRSSQPTLEEIYREIRELGQAPTTTKKSKKAYKLENSMVNEITNEPQRVEVDDVRALLRMLELNAQREALEGVKSDFKSDLRHVWIAYLEDPRYLQTVELTADYDVHIHGYLFPATERHQKLDHLSATIKKLKAQETKQVVFKINPNQDKAVIAAPTVRAPWTNYVEVFENAVRQVIAYRKQRDAKAKLQ